MKVFNTALVLVAIAAVAVAESNGLRGDATERSLQIFEGFSLDGVLAFFESLTFGLGSFCGFLGICDLLPEAIIPSCDSLDNLSLCLEREDCGIDFVIGGVTIASVPPEITDLAQAELPLTLISLSEEGQALNDLALNIFQCVDGEA